MAVGIQGFNPVNLIGGQVYAGAVRQLPIASGYAQNIGFGDLVGISGGYIIRVDNGGSAVTGSTFPAVKPVGIFLGCSFTDPNLKYFVNKQFWPTGTVASDAMALVCEDPEAVLKITLTNAGTAYTSGAATVAAVGKNIGYYQPATPMSTSTGNSLVSANFAVAATTATLPFRIVDLVKDTALPDGTFVEALVTYQLGVHFYRQTTGA
jgi:hypothetical protein